MSADVEALDRGLVDVGLTAAEAMQRIEQLEARLSALIAYMGETAQSAGLPAPQEPAPPRPAPGASPMTAAWLRRYLPRIVSGLALAAVAAVTGRISYIHIYDLTLSLHQPEIVARLMPFGVDGLIVVGSVVLLQPPPGQRWLGWVCVGPGAAISLFANVESGIAFGWLAAGWAGIPAVAFTLSTFTLERWLMAQASAVPGDVPGPDTDWSGLNGHRQAAAELFADDITAGRVPGIRAIRSGLHVGQPTAQQVQAYLKSLTQ